MTSVSEALVIAVKHHQAGRLQRATEMYRQILHDAPNHADALHLLGVAAHQMGKHQSAIDYIARAVARSPHNAGFHSNLGEAYRALRKLDQAVASYTRALKISPDCVQAHHNLGHAYRAQGKLDQAAASYGRALEIKPDYAEAHNSLGAVLKQQGKTEEAIACWRRALRIKPDDADACVNLGNALSKQGKFAEAAASYQQALEITPDCAEAHNNLGNAFKAQGQLDQAVASYGRALEIKPDFAQAHNNLGAALKEQGKLDQAVSSYRRAVELKPDYARAHVNLGVALKEQGQLDQAVASYRRALEIRPAFAEVYYNLGNAFKCQGKADDAAASYQECLRIAPSDRVSYASAILLPIVYQSIEEVHRYRARLVENLDLLLRRGVRFDPANDVLPTAFYLAYQGLNDRPIQQTIARLFQPAQGCAGRSCPAPGGRRGPIRAGFISKYFKDHTIGKLTRGILAQLSREAFQVIVLSVGEHRDADALWIKQHADQYVVVPRHLPLARQTVAGQELDILVYPDIGMDPVTCALARTRLAPVQCVTWGHPVTTGVPAVDYFISSELLEPEDAAEHYSEELVRLKSLPCYYYRPSVPAQLKPRDHFGLATDRHIYLCPQSLFKFHPDFDDSLAGILRRDPAGQVVIIRGSHPYWTELLQKRFQTTIPDCAGRIQFMPSVSRPDFLNLLAVADVLLDPFHFGGGNSTYEALAVGTPLVTLPAAHMRGRITYACYQKMGVPDCVASDPQQYVEIAVRLGTDRAYREAVRLRILSAGDLLFGDIEAVRQLERFFQHAVARSRENAHSSQ